MSTIFSFFRCCSIPSIFVLILSILLILFRSVTLILYDFLMLLLSLQCFWFFIKWDSPCKAEQSLQGMELQEKEAQKRQSIQEICLERTHSWKMSVNSRLKANKIVGQRKAFFKQRILESSCAKKETVDIDILGTSRNIVKNHAMYQNNK